MKTTNHKTSVLCPCCGSFADELRFLKDTNGNKICHRCYYNQTMVQPTPVPPTLPYPSHYEKGRLWCGATF